MPKSTAVVIISFENQYHRSTTNIVSIASLILFAYMLLLTYNVIDIYKRNYDIDAYYIPFHRIESIIKPAIMSTTLLLKNILHKIIIPNVTFFVSFWFHIIMLFCYKVFECCFYISYYVSFAMLQSSIQFVSFSWMILISMLDKMLIFTQDLMFLFVDFLF
jgi:hypothetical protein